MTEVTKTQENREWPEQRREGYSSANALGIMLWALIIVGGLAGGVVFWVVTH